MVGEVEGRHCVIIDDMIDTASTICAAAERLADAGAAEIWAMATHGVFSDPAIDRLEKAPDLAGRRDRHAARSRRTASSTSSRCSRSRASSPTRSTRCSRRPRCRRSSAAPTWSDEPGTATYPSVGPTGEGAVGRQSRLRSKGRPRVACRPILGRSARCSAGRVIIAPGNLDQRHPPSRPQRTNQENAMPEIVLEAQLGRDSGSRASAGSAGRGSCPAPSTATGPIPCRWRSGPVISATRSPARPAPTRCCHSRPASQTYLTLARELQRHPVKGSVTHVDFQIVRRDEVISAEVPVNLIGEAVEVQHGDGMVEQQLFTLPVRAFPADIPNFVELDISELTIGAFLRVADLHLPDGVTVDIDPEVTVAAGLPPRIEVVEASRARRRGRRGRGGRRGG